MGQASDLRNAAPGDEFRRSQASDLRKRRAWRRISTISGLRPAKTPRLATNFDDLRPQTCENAAPGDEFRRSQASDLRTRRAWQRISTISGFRPAKTPRPATNVDDLRPLICKNAAPGDEFRRSQASDLRKRHARRQKSTISGLRPTKTPRQATNFDDLR